MLPKLTVRQTHALVRVYEYIEQHGVPPTTRELQRQLRCSMAGVRWRLYALAAAGYIRIEPRRARGIQVLHRANGLPIRKATFGAFTQPKRAKCGAVTFSERCPFHQFCEVA